MVDTTFTNNETIIYASWLNAINDFFYTLFSGATTAAGARTALGLGTIATQDADSVTITGGSVSGITDIAVADGGTGASTAATARSNLGIVWEPIVSTDVSGTPSAITFTDGSGGVVFDSTYETYMFVLENISMSTEASGNYMFLKLRASGSYQSSSYAYSGTYAGASSSGNDAGSGTTGVSTLIPVTPIAVTLGAATSENTTGYVIITNPSGSTNRKAVFINTTLSNTSGHPVMFESRAVYGSNTPITGVQFGAAVGGGSNTFADTGSISLYGMRAV